MKGESTPGKAMATHPCRTCGTLTKHPYCAAHHPDKDRRRQGHDARAAAYRAKVLRR